MSQLRTRMDNDMVLRGLAERTREAYLRAVTGLAKFYRRSPDQLSEQQVQAYLLHLIKERKCSWSTCNQTAAGLRFLYLTTLRRQRCAFCVPVPKRPRALPQVLSRQEIVQLIECTLNRKHRAILVTAYGAGLRVGELCRLQIGDVDSGLMSIRVNHGKGNRDRYALLSERLLQELRAYWRQYRPKQWLFPSRTAQGPMDISTAQRAWLAAKQRSGIRKQGGIHSLRHAFATHLLEAGTDLHTIQRLLGHRSIRSTMLYLHLAHQQLLKQPSPLDLLQLPESAEL